VNFKEKHPKLADEVDDWSDEVLLGKAKIRRAGKITRTAILLLGRPESSVHLSPADPRITWLLKNADWHEPRFPSLRATVSFGDERSCAAYPEHQL